MPKGPQGQKRPADVIGNAVRVMRIATGEEEEEGVSRINRFGTCTRYPRGGVAS